MGTLEIDAMRYHWTYQCLRCFIKSGYGYVGNSVEAYNNAPTCCSGEVMHTIRGNKVKDNNPY